jgi:maltooligosyltrehalose trehalohydrolase
VWDERDAEPHRTLLAWHRRLIALRRSHPAFGPADRFTDVRIEFSEDDRWLLIDRGAGAVAANLGDGPVTVVLPVHLRNLRVVASSPCPADVLGGVVELARSGVALLG